MSFPGAPQSKQTTIEKMGENIGYLRRLKVQYQSVDDRSSLLNHVKMTKINDVLTQYDALMHHGTLQNCSTSTDSPVKEDFKKFSKALDELNVPNLKTDERDIVGAREEHSKSYYDSRAMLKSEKEREKADKTTIATTTEDQVRYTGKDRALIEKETEALKEKYAKFRAKYKHIKELGGVVAVLQVFYKLAKAIVNLTKSDPNLTEWGRMKEELHNKRSDFAEKFPGLQIDVMKDKVTGETIVRFKDANGEVSANSEAALRVTEEVNRRLSAKGIEVTTNTPQPPAVASDSNKIKAAGEPVAGTFTNTIGSPGAEAGSGVGIGN